MRRYVGVFKNKHSIQKEIILNSLSRHTIIKENKFKLKLIIFVLFKKENTKFS